MLDYLLRQPDALALTLLLLPLAATVALGLAAARRRDRRAAAAEEDAVLVTTWPHLLRRELVATLATLLLLLWWALLVRLPLEPVADAALTPARAKAPWFFIGVQEMLQYFDPWIAGAVLPLLLLSGLCALPYLDVSPVEGGRLTLRRPVALTALVALLTILLLPMVVGQLFRGDHWALQPAWQPSGVEQPLPAARALSLGQRLGLGPRAAQALGGALCLGPLLMLPLLWRRLSRRRPLVARMGRLRFAVAAALVLVALGVVLKVVLVLALDIRYLWVNGWFRI